MKTEILLYLIALYLVGVISGIASEFTFNEKISDEELQSLANIVEEQILEDKLEWFCEDHACYCEPIYNGRHCHYFFED